MNNNPVVHFEIYAKDPDKLGQFYKGLFDWNIDPVPGMDYRMVRTVETDGKGMPTKPGGINGGMLKSPEGFTSSAWVSYVRVDSVDATVEKAKKLGATVTKGKSPVPGMGWFAMFLDPQGNSFAVWHEDVNAK
jgi:predicted enzyme related to lactoylglutathione lyase